MFRAHRAHHQERQIVSIQPLVTVIICWWSCCVQVGSKLPTCTQNNTICASRWTFTKYQEFLRVWHKLYNWEPW